MRNRFAYLGIAAVVLSVSSVGDCYAVEKFKTEISRLDLVKVHVISIESVSPLNLSNVNLPAALSVALAPEVLLMDQVVSNKSLIHNLPRLTLWHRIAIKRGRGPPKKS